MNKPVFVDTSAWLAVINPKDKYHPVAREFYGHALAQKKHLLTSNLVVAETYTNLRWKLGYHKAVSFLDVIERSPRIQCIWSSQELERQARDILHHYDDQDFSYTDAVTFALMKQWKLTEAFAFDHHFLVLGFIQFPSEQ